MAAPKIEARLDIRISRRGQAENDFAAASDLARRSDQGIVQGDGRSGRIPIDLPGSQADTGSPVNYRPNDPESPGQLTPQELKDWYRAFDIDASGDLNVQEYANLTSFIYEKHGIQIDDSFCKVSKRDGHLSARDLQEMLRNNGITWGPGENLDFRIEPECPPYVPPCEPSPCPPSSGGCGSGGGCGGGAGAGMGAGCGAGSGLGSPWQQSLAQLLMQLMQMLGGCSLPPGLGGMNGLNNLGMFPNWLMQNAGMMNNWMMRLPLMAQMMGMGQGMQGLGGLMGGNQFNGQNNITINIMPHGMRGLMAPLVGLGGSLGTGLLGMASSLGGRFGFGGPSPQMFVGVPANFSTGAMNFSNPSIAAIPGDVLGYFNMNSMQNQFNFNLG